MTSANDNGEDPLRGACATHYSRALSRASLSVGISEAICNQKLIGPWQWASEVDGSSEVDRVQPPSLHWMSLDIKHE